MLWQIAQYVPVVTGKWEETALPAAAAAGGDQQTLDSDPNASSAASSSVQVSGVLFSESDYDELGNSLWETFFDYARDEYREYHRLSKRVRAISAAQADEGADDAVRVVDSDRYSESDSQPPYAS